MCKQPHQLIWTDTERKNDMSRGLIVLDPGHGQFGNAHTTREGFYEGTQNFILANALKAQLEARGFEVLTTRPAIEDNPDLEARGKMAGENRAILFLSLHSNAPGSATPPEQYAAVRELPVLVNSDAHRLMSINDAVNYIELDADPSDEDAVREAFFAYLKGDR